MCVCVGRTFSVRPTLPQTGTGFPEENTQSAGKQNRRQIPRQKFAKVRSMECDKLHYATELNEPAWLEVNRLENESGSMLPWPGSFPFAWPADRQPDSQHLLLPYERASAEPAKSTLPV